MLQTYSSFSQAEEFLLTKAENTNGTDWYFIRSVSDPEKYLDVCSKGADGYDCPTLQAKSELTVRSSVLRNFEPAM